MALFAKAINTYRVYRGVLAGSVDPMELVHFLIHLLVLDRLLLLIAIVISIEDTRNRNSLFRLVASSAAPADAHHTFVLLLSQERTNKLVHI